MFVSLVMHVDAIVRLTVRFLMNDLTSDPRHFKRDLFHLSHLSHLIRDGSSLLSVSIPILSDSPVSQSKSTFFLSCSVIIDVLFLLSKLLTAEMSMIRSVSL
ncbi:MAG: hypothetical protein ACI9E1_001909 [Cryomorphaceae bacterium]